jgi:hypothetical protein
MGFTARAPRAFEGEVTSRLGDQIHHRDRSDDLHDRIMIGLIEQWQPWIANQSDPTLLGSSL